MILFAQDWQRYPTAIVHTSTKNRSFVNLALKYKAAGIRNHAFILALINPELEFVDPHDPNLTLDQMNDIAIECQTNPWYFIREVAKAPAMAGSDAVPVEANRGNIALWWSFFNHIFTILIQIRQTGKSFSTDLLMSLLLNIVCEDTQINLLTKDDDLRRKNIQRIKDIMEELPRYLQMKGKDDTNNTEEITIKARGNTYSTHVPQSSPKRALNMGRGLTSPIFHIDEPPFQPNISIALPAALAATGAAVDRAKMSGAPYGTILTTTAGKRDDKDGKYVYKILCDSAVWTEKFFDAQNQVELEKLVRRNSRTGKYQVNITLNHRQLGKSDEWLREKLEAALGEGEDADRDYFNVWTSGSQSNPLPPHVLEKITNSYRGEETTKIDRKYGYITRWYIPDEEIENRMRDGFFVLSLDPSEAGGGDDISLLLTDIETLETVAAGTYNETNLISFAEWLCGWFVKWENFVGIIERRSSGTAILDYLLLMLPQRGIDPFRRLFNTIVNEYDLYPERWKEIRQPMGRRSHDIYTRYKKTFGYTTSGSGEYSRNALYSTALKNAAKLSADRVYDKPLIDQITGLVTRNGRIDHEVGEHDDLVIAWLLCHWLLLLGKNLSHYGIDHKQVMAGVGISQQVDPEEIFIKEEQYQLRRRIEELYEKLSAETDDFVSMRLEQELRLLDKRLILEADEIYSVDNLIRSAKETKRHNRYDSSVRQKRIGQEYRPTEDGYFSDRPYGY